MTKLTLMSATEMARGIADGTVSSMDCVTACFEQIDRLNPKLNAVIWQDRERALAEAEACDAETARGESRGPLHGVPITVKESFDIAGAPSTWGIPAWRDNIAPRDAEVVSAYRDAGGIVFGKTNVPMKLVEWQSFNEIYGSTSNPWDPSRTSGGSSGGSAVAVATGMSALEVGSDIGSSIRNPAHYNGIFGLKPTWNIVSMTGHRAPGWVGDLDIGAGGPIARTAEDLSTAFDVLSTPSRFDRSAWAPALPADPRQRVSEFTVAIKLGDSEAPCDSAYLDAIAQFADNLEAAGATVIRDRTPQIDSAAHFKLYLQLLGAAMSIGFSEAEIAGMMEQFDGAPEDVLRIGGTRMSGTQISHYEWLHLDNARRKARLAFDAFFEDVDVLITPVATGAAFPKDEVGIRHFRRFEVNGAQQLENTQLFWSGYSGVVHLPSVVGPMDQIAGLPVGYQAICGHGRDHTCLAFARACEAEIRSVAPPPIAL